MACGLRVDRLGWVAVQVSNVGTGHARHEQTGRSATADCTARTQAVWILGAGAASGIRSFKKNDPARCTKGTRTAVTTRVATTEMVRSRALKGGRWSRMVSKGRAMTR